jgi:copper chaperone CopZ
VNTTQLQIEIGGMSCGSCVSHVRSALANLPGVRIDDIRIGRAIITVQSSLPEASIRDAIATGGYTLTSVQRVSDGTRETARVAPPPG